METPDPLLEAVAPGKGRVVDALGRPIDGAGELTCGDSPAPLEAAPPAPLARARVHAPLRTGVRVVDLFTPLCLGQRVGVFAGSGVGKSSLLAMLARSTPIDTVVIALVGERGREVREFLDDTLGEGRASAADVELRPRGSAPVASSNFASVAGSKVEFERPPSPRPELDFPVQGPACKIEKNPVHRVVQRDRLDFRKRLLLARSVRRRHADIPLHLGAALSVLEDRP